MTSGTKRAYEAAARFKRGRVGQALVGYAIFMAGSIDAASNAMPRLGIPEWVVTGIVVTELLALPLLLLVVWRMGRRGAARDATEVPTEGVSARAEAALSPVIAAAPGHSMPDPALPTTADAQHPQRPSARRGFLGRAFAAPGFKPLLAFGLPLALLTTGYVSVREPLFARVGLDPTLVVLPFTDLSDDPEYRYFSEGITEEITSLMVQVNGLRVAALPADWTVGDEGVDPRRIGQELGVDNVLLGSVRRSESRLRVTAKLVETRGGYALWSGSFDSGPGDVLDIQDSIGGAIATVLRSKLLAPNPEPVRLVRATADPAAYDLYLRGRHLQKEESPEALTKSIEYLDEAVGRDPRFAAAHASLAEGYMQVAARNPGSMVARERARAAADVALALQPSLAQSRPVLITARSLGQEGSPPASPEPPDDGGAGGPAVGVSSGGLLVPIRTEADSASEDAGPVGQASVVSSAPYHTGEARAAYLTRDFARAAASWRHVLQDEPRNARAHEGLGWALLLVGDAAAAEASFREATRLRPRPGTATAGLVWALRLAGEAAQARAAAEPLLEGSAGMPAALARLGLGDTAGALETLEAAVAAGSVGPAALREEPALDGLRGDARFQRLLAGR